MKLPTRIVEKPWGRRDLPAPFRNPGTEAVGEIWFEPPPELAQVLVKYLFTSEKLSVQVHPSDAQAPQGQRGKEECWLVLDAEPGATLGIGLKQAIAPEAMRAAALDGSIEGELEWHPVGPGDFFYLPAGTVHAIGPGLTLVEVQQNSDITYRLFDYGRPRELHLDRGIAVAKGEPYPRTCRQKVTPEESITLVNGPFFRLSQCSGRPGPELCAIHSGAVMALPLAGSVEIARQAVSAGECALATSLGEIDFAEAERVLLVSAA